MAMTAVAYGQARAADVLYTYFDDTPVHGIRVGDECFVPIEDLARWGWQVNVQADVANIKAEGLEFSMPVRMIGGRTSLPLKASMIKLGGAADWISNTDTLQIISELTKVRYESGKVHVTAPLQLKPKAFSLKNPDRVVLDYIGAKIGPKTSQTVEGGVRLTQFKPNVVRMVIQTNGAPDLTRISSEPTKSSEIQIAVLNSEVSEARPVEATPLETKSAPLSTDEAFTNATPATSVPIAPSTPAYLPLGLEREDARGALFSIKLARLKNPAQYKKPDPSSLEILLPDVFLELAPDFKLVSNSVSLARTEKTATGTLVTLYLNRPMGAEVVTDSSGVSIQLIKPNVGNGKLVGKVIVVDAGHGGTDPGANGGGFREKDLTLAIAKLVGGRLAEEGATVIMTRKTDVLIDLKKRPVIANDNHADLFLSCHINDTGTHRKMTGTITFHHKGNAMSHVLAECIQNEIAKVSGLPNTGVWSDGKIYQSGFAVLRGIKMPGVLIEFGFIDNPQDRRRLVEDEFQQAVARAVVKGVKVYLGDAQTN